MQDASIGWGEPNGLKDPLLTGVKLKVEKGQRVLVLGPNGAGKTTLLKVLSGTPNCPWLCFVCCQSQAGLCLVPFLVLVDLQHSSTCKCWILHSTSCSHFCLSQHGVSNVTDDHAFWAGQKLIYIYQCACRCSRHLPQIQIILFVTTAINVISSYISISVPLPSSSWQYDYQCRGSTHLGWDAASGRGGQGFCLLPRPCSGESTFTTPGPPPH